MLLLRPNDKIIGQIKPCQPQERAC